jgi:hypothetical protein
LSKTPRNVKARLFAERHSFEHVATLPLEISHGIQMNFFAHTTQANSAGVLFASSEQALLQ